VINGGDSAEDGERVVYAGADGRDATGRLVATLNRAIAAVATLFEDATRLDDDTTGSTTDAEQS